MFIARWQIKLMMMMMTLSDHLCYRADSPLELVMIHCEQLLIVHGFTEDGNDIFYVT